MPDPHHPLATSIVRILDAEGIIVGAGFLATPYLICTCAHVVADALGVPRKEKEKPQGDVLLDFPFFRESERRASVQDWVPMEPDDGGGDIAILRLRTEPPSEARSVRLLPMQNHS